jgi:dTDP-4-dehydrorhamnose reductase
MNKILVTGSQGQLGSSIRKIDKNYQESEFFYTDVAELDITNRAQVLDFVKGNGITHIVNCAAYTAVDKAEQEYDLAKKINATGPAILAEVAAMFAAHFIHISTDYVFDGKGYEPYAETDYCDTPSAYGKSKLLGEQMVLEEGVGVTIIRTSWLYSEFGNNFMKTMLKYGKERPELKVVYDQIGSPTYATDLATAILSIIHSGKKTDKNEIYHYSNEGVASWYDFAYEIIIGAQLNCKVTPILTYQYPLPAPRPYYSVLNKAKIKKDFNITIPHWRDSMLECLSILEGH